MNKQILIGNLGKDPEMSYTPSGVAVCKFSIATTERWKDKDGNRKEETDWHNVVAYRKAAETLSTYLAKGSKVYIEGRTKTRSWDDKKTGEKRYMTEVVVDSFEFLGEAKKKGAPKEEPVTGPPPDDLPF
jgi:single-strand DNA-binding protein